MSGVLLVLIVVVAYWTPSLVAFCRCRRNPGQVVVVNAFLGWTFIGWVVALTMAFGTAESVEA